MLAQKLARSSHHASKLGSARFSLSGHKYASSAALPDVSKQNISGDIQDLRDSFREGGLQPLSARKQVLKQLQTLMKEGEAMLTEAVYKDFRKPADAFKVAEIDPINFEIQSMLDNMDEWSKVEEVPTQESCKPAKSFIKRDPLGTVCIISTWNYPVNLSLVPLAGVIAAGNCAVLRLPGDDTAMHTNNALIHLIDKYMDKRYIRYVYGGVPETKEMLKHKFDLILATGGNMLGQIVAKAAAEHLTPTILELGGKSPVFVDDTVDIEHAAERVVWGAFFNSGQTCIRPDYVLVDKKIGEKFVKAMEEAIVKAFGNDPKTSDKFERLINDRSFARVSTILNEDKHLVTYGGKSDPSQRYIEPTLVNFKDDYKKFLGSASMGQEIFGPILPIYYYNSMDEGIKHVMDRPKPLSLYLCSKSNSNKEYIMNNTTSGSLVINDSIVQYLNHTLPFGGVGNSGMGAYHGKFSFDAFSHLKAVMFK